MNGVLELRDVAAVLAAQHVVRLQETDADEFLHQSVPLALEAFLISIGKRFLQHRERPSFRERKGRIPLFEVPGHLRTQGLELPFCPRLTRRRHPGDPVDVGRVRGRCP